VSEFVRTRLAASDERRELKAVRGTDDVCWARTDEPEPLVTVRIATYGRQEVVVERAIASALRQTYERLEIIVVGDHCEDGTEKAVLAVKDPRVRFFNLGQQGRYPADPFLRWCVAGSAPWNLALALANGAWIAPCDDDDEFTDDHVEVLLGEARKRRLEFVWSKALGEVAPGVWEEMGGPDPLVGTSHGSMLYASQLGFFHYNLNSWKLAQVADWNLWNRMKRAGVRMGFLDQVTYRYHLAPTNLRSEPGASRA
jgi:glycosyltransferase involved in cell wall biosynthesis